MYTAEQREAAARELAGEIVLPPGLQVQAQAFDAFKQAARAAGVDADTATRLIAEYAALLKK
jgi:hypothetical protein